MHEDGKSDDSILITVTVFQNSTEGVDRDCCQRKPGVVATRNGTRRDSHWCFRQVTCCLRIAVQLGVKPGSRVFPHSCQNFQR